MKELQIIIKSMKTRTVHKDNCVLLMLIWGVTLKMNVANK